MIYICADDYGLSRDVNKRIMECIDGGALNKVSAFPNFDEVHSEDILSRGAMLSLHLNLVEGRCMASADEIALVADEKGNFRHTFGGIFKLSLFRKKELEKQLYKEVRAQVLYWKGLLPEGADFCIDSHQHTHMIPSVFRVLTDVLADEGITPKYMRIPVEPIMPFIKSPTLYFTYKPINIIKQWLLNFLWLFNKGCAKKHNIKRAYFFGILFSGRMDEKRVLEVLPKIKRLGEKKGVDTEVLFHPGYTTDLEGRNIVFEKFYLSYDRKTEYDSVMKISERRVHNNALH